jgi:hypothetical protein|tara:strand:- start:325 stop:426 length:102 start_codon:yes stop_codon:yes gene_type:complete
MCGRLELLSLLMIGRLELLALLAQLMRSYSWAH